MGSNVGGWGFQNPSYNMQPVCSSPGGEFRRGDH